MGWRGYAWAIPPPTGTGRSVGGGLSVGRLLGWVMDENVGIEDKGSCLCCAAPLAKSCQNLSQVAKNIVALFMNASE